MTEAFGAGARRLPELDGLRLSAADQCQRRASVSLAFASVMAAGFNGFQGKPISVKQLLVSGHGSPIQPGPDVDLALL